MQPVVSIISLHVHPLWINLLNEFGNKTNGRNTTRNKFIRYLCFIVVVFMQGCHHRLKMSNFSLKKRNSVNRSDLLAINAATAFTILKSIEYKLLKRFLVQGWQESFLKFSILSNTLDLEWWLSNKWKLHSTAFRHVYLTKWQRWLA